jgi:hypothetical protein
MESLEALEGFDCRPKFGPCPGGKGNHGELGQGVVRLSPPTSTARNNLVEENCLGLGELGTAETAQSLRLAAALSRMADELRGLRRQVRVCMSSQVRYSCGWSEGKRISKPIWMLTGYVIPVPTPP